MSSMVPIDPRVSLSEVVFKNVLNGANWMSVASLESQSNSGLPCYFLVRHKRADAVFKGRTASGRARTAWQNVLTQFHLVLMIPLSRYACELLLMKLVRFWCRSPQRNLRSGGESPPSGRADAVGILLKGRRHQKVPLFV